jgi:quercetin dioxygenase-like cupin family protein
MSDHLEENDVRTAGASQFLAPTAHLAALRQTQERQRRNRDGRLVVHDSETEWEVSEMGREGHMVSHADGTVALQDWRVFKLEFESHSGAHTHQGVPILYVTKGKGHTMVDGQRVDWKEGDLVVLPVKPGGCEHQHFNDSDDGSSSWVAFIYLPFFYATGAQLVQNSVGPEGAALEVQ